MIQFIAELLDAIIDLFNSVYYMVVALTIMVLVFIGIVLLFQLY